MNDEAHVTEQHHPHSAKTVRIFAGSFVLRI